jgi:pSer/pThr/pTyr-binding forkhead associated (FHA) protein
MGTSDAATEAVGRGGTERLRLKVAAGNAAGTVIEVEDELIIGRQASGAGTLAQDIEISRRHARIASGPDGRYLLEDLGSTNGTWVNGRRIESSTVLEIGDRIELGGSELVVQVGAIPEATPPAGTEVPLTGAIDTRQGGPELPADEQGPDEPGVHPPAPGRISLRIDVDLEAMEAAVSLGEEADEVLLVHEGGRWRLK